MNGMEMMMKMLGFDPKQAQEHIQKGMQQAQSIIAHFNVRASQIEEKLDLANAKMEIIMAALDLKMIRPLQQNYNEERNGDEENVERRSGFTGR